MLTIAIALSIMTFMTTIASAARSIYIVNGNRTLNITPVLLHDGRTYAPYDTLFKAFGATADYDEKTRTITVVSGETTVTIPLDNYYSTVTTGDDTYELYNFDMPIENTSSGKIYVPIRFAAQALGYVVKWDDQTRTITLQTIDELIDESGATYTVIDRVLAYNRSFAQKSHAFSGTFKLTMDLGSLSAGLGSDAETSAIEPLTLNGTATGLIDGGGQELSMNFKTNISDFAGLMSGAEAFDAETSALLTQLDNIDINLIVNNETGVTYFKSPLLSVIAGTDQDAWVSIETGEAALLSVDSLGMSDISALSLGNPLTEELSFRDIVTKALKNDLRVGGYGDPEETLKTLNNLYSDQAMTKNGDDYVVTIKDSSGTLDDEEDTYSSETVTTITFSFAGEIFEGLSFSSSAATSYEFMDEVLYSNTTKLSYFYSTDGKGGLSMSTSVGETKLLDMAVDFTFSESSEEPLREPAEGSTVISMDDLLEGVADEMEGLEEFVP